MRKKINYLYNHTKLAPLKKVKKLVNGQTIHIELFPDDEKDKKILQEVELVRAFDKNLKKVFDEEDNQEK